MAAFWLPPLNRILIVREYLESGVSAEKIIKKYHISSRSVLFSWMDKFLNDKDLSPLHQESDSDEDMAKTKDELLKEKDAEIKRLRKALELENLRSHAYSTMRGSSKRGLTSDWRLHSSTRATKSDATPHSSRCRMRTIRTSMPLHRMPTGCPASVSAVCTTASRC